MGFRKVDVILENGKKVTYRYTDKQLAFVEAYLLTFNGTESAKLAKYNGTRKVLSIIAFENLRKPKIAALLKMRMSSECMTATETLLHLSKLARGFDITKYITEFTTDDGEQLVGINFEKIRADGFGDLIKSISPQKGGGLRVDIIDRLPALNSVAKIHAMLTDILVNAQVTDEDKGLLDDDDRKRFAASILGRVDRRSKRTRKEDS